MGRLRNRLRKTKAHVSSRRRAAGKRASERRPSRLAHGVRQRRTRRPRARQLQAAGAPRRTSAAASSSSPPRPPPPSAPSAPSPTPTRYHTTTHPNPCRSVCRLRLRRRRCPDLNWAALLLRAEEIRGAVWRLRGEGDLRVQALQGQLDDRVVSAPRPGVRQPVPLPYL